MKTFEDFQRETSHREWCRVGEPRFWGLSPFDRPIAQETRPCDCDRNDRAFEAATKFMAESCGPASP